MQKDIESRANRMEEIIGTIEISDSSGREALWPKPSLDPNDPLNWSSWEKYTTYGTICFYSFLATTNVSNFGVAIVTLSKYFHESNTRISYLVCFNTLMLGVGNLFWVPLMRVIGKRPVFLIAIALLAVFNVWSFKATTYRSLLAARLLSGFAAAAGDATVPAVVADMFFVHERGFVMMIFHVALSGGFFIGPVINGYVVQDTNSWQWACGWIAIASGVNWLIALFFIRETSYPNRDVNAPSSSFGPKRGLLSHLAVTRGYNKEESFLNSLYNIISIAVYPPVVWAGITVGVFVGWNIIIQLETSVLFSAPPYLWTVHSLGLIALSGFIGTLLAVFVGGMLIDMIANSMTNRNHGRREPEYRLLGLVIPAIIGPMGILIFGICAAKKTSWVGLAFGYGMQGFGLTAVSNVLVTYAVDSYFSLAGETIVFFFVIRAILGCVLALFAFQWIDATGTENAFGQMVAIQFFAILFCILFLIKGKQIRQWTATYGPLKRQAKAFTAANDSN